MHVSREMNPPIVFGYGIGLTLGKIHAMLIVVMDMTTNIKDLSFLENLGFSSNEAKAYVALLANGPLNGYEIALKSGISRSVVYGVLKRLVQKGYIYEIEGENSKYKALEYQKLLEKIKKQTDEQLNEAKDKLKQFDAYNNRDEFVMNVVSRSNFMERACELILGAKEELYLSIWEEDMESLRPALEEVIRRGVRVYVFSFTKIHLDGAKIFSYGIADTERLFPGRRVLLLQDQEMMAVGEVRNEEMAVSIITANPPLINLATDGLVMEIFCYQILRTRTGGELPSTAEEFQRLLGKEREKLGIDSDMPKNYMVYQYQN